MTFAPPGTFPDIPPLLTLPIAPEIQALQHKTDSEVAAFFEASTGHLWTQSLHFIMAERQTPELIRVMARHIDEIKGINHVSGEALYAPALNFPIAIVLIECGDKALVPLVHICASATSTRKQRVLAALVITHIQTHPDLPQLETHLRTATQRQLLRDSFTLASSPRQAAAILEVEILSTASE